MKISQRAARAMQQHLQELLDISNSEHWAFKDSSADVVEALWSIPKAAHHLLKTEAPQFVNHYRHCGQEWSDTWSSMCNDKCPKCNAEIEPHKSDEVPA